MAPQYFVYILSNRHNTVLYTGVTNDLKRRVYWPQVKKVLITLRSEKIIERQLYSYRACPPKVGVSRRGERLRTVWNGPGLGGICSGSLAERAIFTSYSLVCRVPTHSHKDKEQLPLTWVVNAPRRETLK